MTDYSVCIVSLSWVLRNFKDGDEQGWDKEFTYLRENHSRKLEKLINSIKRQGIQIPIVLGNDGRVWDGHHRLIAAFSLKMQTVPVILPEYVNNQLPVSYESEE